jgi:hypothetical protein
MYIISNSGEDRLYIASSSMIFSHISYHVLGLVIHLLGELLTSLVMSFSDVLPGSDLKQSVTEVYEGQ